MEMVDFGQNTDKFPRNEPRLEVQFIAQKVRFGQGYTGYRFEKKNSKNFLDFFFNFDRGDPMKIDNFFLFSNPGFSAIISLSGSP